MKGQKVIPPPPVEIQGEMEYEVEKILSKRKRYGKVEYLVRWRGYTAEEDTWKKEENLGNAQEAVEDYEKEYEKTAKRIREEEDGAYSRSELLGRYTTKVLYGDGGDKSKIGNILGVCPFIRDKGDRRKSEVCNLRDGLQLYANK